MYSQCEVKRNSLGPLPLLLFCCLICTATVIAGLRYSQIKANPSGAVVRQRIAVLLGNALKERQRITPEGRTLWVPIPPSEEAVQEVKGYGDKAVPILAEYLRSGSHQERELAMQFLGALGGDRIVKPLLTVIRNDPEPSLREGALTYIAQLSWEVTYPILREAAKTDSDPRVREKAQHVLDRHEALEVKSPSESLIRKRITMLMGYILQRAEAVTSDGVKIQSVARPSNEEIEEIKHYGDAAIPILTEYLASGDGGKKVLAIRFLGILGGSRIIGPLEDVIHHDPSPSIREIALRWLTEAPWDTVSPIIRQAAQNDPDPNVRQTARELLDSKNPK